MALAAVESASPLRGARFDAVVVGAGIHGLAAAYQLSRLGAGRVALIEQFEIGHDRGSSHGATRITRTSYGSLPYARLMRVAHGEEWPRLESEAGLQLLYRCDGCYFGPPGGPFEEYARVVAAASADVERLDPAEGRRRFPNFRFDDCAGVLHDRTGGVIAASDAVAALARICGKRGVEILERTRIIGIDPSRDPIRLDSDRGAIEADRCVIAAGPWAPRLLPILGKRLTPIRQTVGYFRLAGGAGDYPNFPVWAYLGAEANSLWYGLPSFRERGIKAARHVVAGPADDPDTTKTPADADLRAIRAFLETQLSTAIEETVGSETCFYTNTASEDFIVDLHPENPRIAIASPCSGHGFKLAPVVGRVVAELVMTGRSTIPEFEESRATFAAGG